MDEIMKRTTADRKGGRGDRFRVGLDARWLKSKID